MTHGSHKHDKNCIRVVNNIVKGPPIDILLDGVKILANIGYKIQSEPVKVKSGNHSISVLSGNIILVTSDIYLKSKKTYSIFVNGNINDLSTVTILSIPDKKDKPACESICESSQSACESTSVCDKSSYQPICKNKDRGPQGCPGCPGPKGCPGSKGCSGEQGPRGCPGEQGPRGDQGCRGHRGVQGDQGAQGSQGVRGPQGAQGLRGVQGPQGVQGSVGFQGAQGSLGNTGAQGVVGSQGSVGNTGTQGAQGAQGAQGVVGSQGTLGNTGAQGAQGSDGVDGAQGAQGVQGAQGIGDTGAQGAVGAQGPGVGATGAQGAPGSIGPQGPGVGSTGAQGPPGPVGVTGAQGSQGFTGAQGTQGFIGPQGIPGVTGAQGVAGQNAAESSVFLWSALSQSKILNTTITFTGSMSGTTTLTVTGVPTGPIRLGMLISGTGITIITQIVAFGTGTGGAGTYIVDKSQTFGSTTITGLYSQFQETSFEQPLSGPPGNGWVVSSDISTFTGTISGTTLTVTLVSTGSMAVGMRVTGAGVALNTFIQSQLTGSFTGAGTYRVSVSQTVGAPTAMTGTNYTKFSCPTTGWYLMTYKFDIRTDSPNTGFDYTKAAAALMIQEGNNWRQIEGSGSSALAPDTVHMYSISNTVLVEYAAPNSLISLQWWSGYYDGTGPVLVAGTVAGLSVGPLNITNPEIPWIPGTFNPDGDVYNPFVEAVASLVITRIVQA